MAQGTAFLLDSRLDLKDLVGLYDMLHADAINVALPKEYGVGSS